MSMDTQPTLFDKLFGWRQPQEATNRRNEALQDVVENAGPTWAQQCRSLADRYVTQLEPGSEFMGEEMRHWCLAQGLDQPHHPNAWGGVLGAAIRTGMKDGVIETAGFRQSASATSHRHRFSVYRKVNP